MGTKLLRKLEQKMQVAGEQLDDDILSYESLRGSDSLVIYSRITKIRG